MLTATAQKRTGLVVAIAASSLLISSGIAFLLIRSDSGPMVTLGKARSGAGETKRKAEPSAKPTTGTPRPPEPTPLSPEKDPVSPPATPGAKPGPPEPTKATPPAPAGDSKGSKAEAPGGAAVPKDTIPYEDVLAMLDQVAGLNYGPEDGRQKVLCDMALLAFAEVLSAAALATNLTEVRFWRERLARILSADDVLPSLLRVDLDTRCAPADGLQAVCEKQRIALSSAAEMLRGLDWRSSEAKDRSLADFRKAILVQRDKPLESLLASLTELGQTLEVLMTQHPRFNQGGPRVQKALERIRSMDAVQGNYLCETPFQKICNKRHRCTELLALMAELELESEGAEFFDQASARSATADKAARDVLQQVRAGHLVALDCYKAILAKSPRLDGMTRFEKRPEREAKP